MKKSDILTQAFAMLKENNIPDWEDSAKRLLAFALNVEYYELYKLDNIDDNVSDKYFELISERARHVPLDKIIGYTYFYTVKIPYDKNVLSPRLETEFLVDRVVTDIRLAYKQSTLSKEFDNISVLDLCSGSGCIGLAIANTTGANVTLSDISKSAIAVAKNNCKLNNDIRLEKKRPPINVSFIVSDMFEDIPYKFDMIVCNPPYIRTSDLKKIEIEVKDFDPILALDGGKDGLDFYKTIAKDAKNYLNTNGRLYLEIGINQSDKVIKLLEKNFENIEVIKDLAGIDRFIIAKKRD